MLQNCSSKQNNGRNVLLLFTSILFPYECNTGSEGGFRQIFFLSTRGMSSTRTLSLDIFL